MDKKLKEYLDTNHIKYIATTHSPAFTSQEIAASAHVSGKEMAKTVIVKIDGKLGMVVIPGNKQINFNQLKTAINATTVDLASEMEFKNQFPDSEVGAMSPFGNLYGMPVYISQELAVHDHLIFNAGSHAELMQVSYQDFAKLVKPKVVDFS